MPTLKQMGYEGIVSHKFPGNEIQFFFGFYLCLNSIPRLSFFFSSNPVTISMIAYLYFFFVSFTSTSLPLLSSSSVFMQRFPSLFYLSLLLTSLFCNLSYSSLYLSSPNYFCHLFQVVKQKHFEEWQRRFPPVLLGFVNSRNLIRLRIL